MAWKWQRCDVSRHTGGDLAAALGRIQARTLVLPINTDMFFTVEDCQAEAALIPGAQCRPLISVDGHLGLIGRGVGTAGPPVRPPAALRTDSPAASSAP